MNREETSKDIAKEIKFSLKYRFIEVHKSSNEFPSGTVKCPVSIYFGEAIRHSQEGVYLPFTAFFETKPDFVSFKIKGEAFIEGMPQKVDQWVIPKRSEPPRIWSWVYKDIQKVVAKLVECLKVSLPDDLWINKSVRE